MLGSTREGHWEGREELRLAGAKHGAQRAGMAHRGLANEFYETNPVVDRIKALKSSGSSLRAIARALNEEGLPARRGGEWSASQVRNVLMR